MKKQNILLIVLFLVLCLPSLYAEPGLEYSTRFNMINYGQNISSYRTALTLQPLESYNENTNPPVMNSVVSNQTSMSSGNLWEDLRKWIDEGQRGLDESTESLMILEKQLAELQAENSEQESLLTQSQELLTSLRRSLVEAQTSVEIAVDRMQDAENYALWIDAQNIVLNQKIKQQKKSGAINFAFGSVSLGVGAPLMVGGIRSDNRTMVWTGTGVMLGTGLAWAAGHFIFNWW